jgi:hypothetical protein
MYTLWPEALAPWDDAIRARLNLDGSTQSYRNFIESVVPSELESLKRDAARFRVALEDIPVRLGRPSSSLPKLVDEYFWVTITQNHRVPGREMIKEWALWSA